MAELFEIPDPLARVEVVAPPFETVEVHVEPEEVMVPPRKSRVRRWKIRYSQHWTVRAPYRRYLSVAQHTRANMQRRQSDRLTNYSASIL